jgi:hypothetical protein
MKLGALFLPSLAEMLYREHLKGRKATGSTLVFAITGYLVSLDICIHWLWR